MELASGKVRYEFSGPGKAGWFAAFTPRGDAFLASVLFGRAVQRWPTAHVAEKGRRAPEPLGRITLPEGAGTVVRADVSAEGVAALGTHDGDLYLVRPAGSEAAILADVPGEGAVETAFTPSGRHLVAVRDGAVWTRPVPRPRQTDDAR